MKTRSTPALAGLLGGALLASALGTVLGATATAATGAAEPAQADKAGNKSLATVLGKDGTELDRNWHDFDIVEAAVYAVLDAKPDSPVAVLADGKTRLTAFIPNDRAFQLLVKDLKGFAPGTEAKTVKQVLKLADVDTLETVLLYHVVAGDTLLSPTVVKAAEADTIVKTAAGMTIRVAFAGDHIALVDKDRNDRNPHAIGSALDINEGNKQVAHGIDRVLRPLDL